MAIKNPGFFSRNVVMIVMVPTLVLIHWGWSKMQDIEILIKKEEKKDLPILVGAKYLEEKFEKKWSSIFTKDSSSTEDK